MAAATAEGSEAGALSAPIADGDADTKQRVLQIPHGAHVPNPLTEGKPRMYICSFAVSKKTNVGNLVRSAVAFGAHELIVIGKTKIGYFGGQGTRDHLFVRHFSKLQEAKAWFVEEGITVCGVEIGGASEDVTTHPFRGHTAFFLGNEGTGMADSVKSICDHFVYIKHFGTGTASLNVTVAGSIVLHHFATWAGYDQAPLDPANSEKFTVQRVQYDGSQLSEAALAKRQARAAKRARTDAGSA